MRRESGQVAVEAALVIPLWLMVALGAIQLALLQQARLVTEYGAYCAARAGSVWSGNNERMRDAALLAVLPSFGAASTLPALGKTYERARVLDQKLHDALAPASNAPETLKQSGLLGLVRVDVLSPSEFPHDRAELDFDSADTFDDSDHRRAYESFAAGRLDPSQEELRDATVLTVRVRYLFELKVPFANQAIFAGWFATATAPTAGEEGSGTASSSAGEAELLRALADGSGPLGSAHRFFIPLHASAAQRMQSNFYRKWLTHSEQGR